MTLWADRDEPVLRHLMANPPQHAILWTNRFQETPRADLPALTESEFHRSVQILGDAGYVGWNNSEGEGSGGWAFMDFLVTGTGKQALGLWPRFESLGSPVELAALLNALGENAATEEERSNLKQAGEAVRRSAPDVLKSVAAGALGALARSQLGL